MSANKLIETIRAVVRAELKNTLKPMLKEVLKPLVKEMVEGQVNAVLAEKFIKSIETGQTVMKEQQMSFTPQQAPAPTPVQKKQMTEDRRKELMRKIGVDADPMAQLIYGDIDVNQRVAPPGAAGGGFGGHTQILQNGQVYDPEADDEGVDISGLF